MFSLFWNFWDISVVSRGRQIYDRTSPTDKITNSWIFQSLKCYRICGLSFGKEVNDPMNFSPMHYTGKGNSTVYQPSFAPGCGQSTDGHTHTHTHTQSQTEGYLSWFFFVLLPQSFWALRNCCVVPSEAESVNFSMYAFVSVHLFDRYNERNNINAINDFLYLLFI